MKKRYCYLQLREKRGSFGYSMAVYISYKEMKAALKEMEKKGEVLPILLFFYKGKEE